MTRTYLNLSSTGIDWHEALSVAFDFGLPGFDAEWLIDQAEHGALGRLWR